MITFDTTEKYTCISIVYMYFKYNNIEVNN